MTIQILSFVLYSHDGEVRTVEIKKGRLNIITGESKAGKSALVRIVDYVFGSDKCEVQVGAITSKVSWFGLRISVPGGVAFVARRNPIPSGLQSSEEVVVRIGTETEPAFQDMVATTNTDGLRSLLAEWLGIPPRATKSGPRLAVSPRNSVALMFQPQQVIANPDLLFYGTSNPFVARSLRDSFPYLIGAVDSKFMDSVFRLRAVEEELRSTSRKQRDIQSIHGAGLERAQLLLKEAAQLGLEVPDVEPIQALQSLDFDKLSSVDTEESEAMTRLLNDREKLLERQQKNRAEIATINALLGDEDSYRSELTEGMARLSSVALFGSSEGSRTCPLCSAELSPGSPPLVEEVAKSLEETRREIDSIHISRPHIQDALLKAEAKLAQVRHELAANRTAAEALRNTDERYAGIRSAAIKAAHMLGRISLFLESIPESVDVGELERKIAGLEKQKDLLTEAISDEVLDGRVQDIVLALESDMTQWARELGLEHSKRLMLDLRHLTVVSYPGDGPVPLVKMGSAENYIGCHVIAHLALHKWFSIHSCPVPRVIFFDQPSQAYFPTDARLEPDLNNGGDAERQRVVGLYQLINTVVGSLGGQLQVIVVDHADLNIAFFQDAVVEKWRNGRKLVPDEWREIGSL